jgi:glutamyl-tRNA synthetase
MTQESTKPEAAGEAVRVRFAPSPTGYLHIGGARTALFNYLFARQCGGTLVLRIEDTDRERSTPEATQAILDGMRFLGLDWDEGPEVGGDYGPYFQSERDGLHRELVERLLAAGRAYPCFKTSEELARLREEHRDATSFTAAVREDLDPTEVSSRLDAGEKATVRFRVPEGETVIDDMVRGEVRVSNSDIEDFVIARADGSAVYNLAVVGDDNGMGITHVMRGEDHLSNTSKQLLLFEALGFSVPRYAHISLILAPGGGKLSKRHGAVSVTEYEEKGYLPEAMINFLARMGWSYDDKEELFSLEDLVEKFSIDGVSKSGAVYDLKKLDHLGGHYMRQRPLEELVEMSLPFLLRSEQVQIDLEEVISGGGGRERFEAIIALEQERINRIGELPERVGYYFEDPEEPDKGARKALRKKKDSVPLVERYSESLTAQFPDGWGPGDHEALEEHVKSFLEQEDAGLGDLAQPVRAVLTGRGATPGLFEVMAILGMDTCLRRLGKLQEWVDKAIE